MVDKTDARHNCQGTEQVLLSMTARKRRKKQRDPTQKTTQADQDARYVPYAKREVDRTGVSLEMKEERKKVGGWREKKM